MKILMFFLLLFSFFHLKAQDLSFKYLVVYDEKTDDYETWISSSTLRFNFDDSGDVLLLMENTPSVRLSRLTNPVDGMNDGLEYITARFLLKGKETDLFIYENDNIILRNLSNKKYMLFTNHNDPNGK